jgi:hypothetical protein
MLVYLVDENESWLWVVRRDQLQLPHLAIGAAALSRDVTVLRQRLDPLQNPIAQAFPATRAYELYEQVFAPATPFLAEPIRFSLFQTALCKVCRLRFS